MFKKTKSKALRVALSVLTGVTSTILVFFLVVYLATPRYQFTEPQPFSGKHLHNPYEGMDPSQWKRYNFHCHSRQFFGIVNGHFGEETTIDSIYMKMGYDHYGISDYLHINRHGSDQAGYIPAYEHGYGLFRKTHQLCLGADAVWPIDYPFAQNLDMKQHTINKLGEKCRFVVPAHPSFTKGYKVRDMKYLSNYKLLEILNPYGNGVEHWDMALSNGHLVYGIANDDTHDVLNPNEVGRFFTVINTSSLDSDSVYAALEAGRSYAVNFNPYHNEPFEDKTNALKTMPHVTRFELKGDTLLIETSEPIVQADFFGQDGVLLASERRPGTASYVIRPEDTYVRAVIEISPGHCFIYFNPVTRHETPVPTETRLDSINVTQSVMMWMVYVVAVLFSLYAFIKKKKESKNAKP